MGVSFQTRPVSRSIIGVGTYPAPAQGVILILTLLGILFPLMKGLDPHLPPAAVAYQMARVAAARQLPLRFRLPNAAPR